MNFLIDRGEGALLTAGTLEGERFRLSLERIRQMKVEEETDPVFVPYFQAAAAWVLFLLDQRRSLEDGTFDALSLDELQEANRALYEDILPGNYEKSWANPVYCAKMFGREYGQVMAALFYEMRCMISLVYESDAERFLIRMELLLEVYCAFTAAFTESGTDEEDGRQGRKADRLPPVPVVRDMIRQFLEDYAGEEILLRARRTLAGGSISERVIDGFVPGDKRCLYRYGAYVSGNETGAFAYLDGLEEETIARMADTWTEGFRIGFEVTGKDLSIRRSAGIIYHIGFERVVHRAAENLRKMGLKAVIPGQQADLFTQHLGRGGASLETTSPNPQYAYDHREDLALFFNDVLRSRRLQGLQEAYKTLASEAAVFAGPVCMDTFGERPFSPVIHDECPQFSKAQQKKISQFRQQADLLYDRAVIGKERSFTIIAFPLPEITRGYAKGDLTASYDEIFRAVIDINTLDYMTYRTIQAGIISVLDTARSIHVTGRKGNRTDLTVRLQRPQDPEKQTIFENCVADVNIPVGEVFTTPELQGTDGLLHVTRVFLEGLLFEDLAIRFENGRTAEYSCGGFPTAEEGRKYIEENILFHHETLPMGEFAIGTNTKACADAGRLGILERLPILIAEKTGPHFAVGDTCYSHEEDNRTFNPDGKEIFAKENEYSRMRACDPDKAYFGCHMDITIPYEEVGLLAAVREDGTEIPVIRDGLFVLPGTELLNDPLFQALDRT